jgi:subtilisin family serine protease
MYRAPTAICILAVLACCAAFQIPSRAAEIDPAAAAPSPEQVIWTSTSSNATGFAAEVSQLYLNLYNTGRLSLRRNVKATSGNIEQVLRANGNLVGPVFPRELDSLACDLNSNRCFRDREPVAFKDAQQLPSQSLTGFAPSPTKWLLGPGDLLVLPSIRLTVVPKWVQVDVKDNVEKIVISVLGGCQSFNTACRDDIIKHNRQLDPANPQFVGPLILPVIAARASIDITSSDESPSAETHSEQRPDRNLELSPQRDGSYKIKSYGFDKSAPAPPNSRSDLIETLKRNSIGVPNFHIRFSAEHESTLLQTDFRQQREELAKLIAFPFADSNAYPSNLRGAVVGVFDSWVDDHHCGFDSHRLVVHNISTGAPDPITPGTCTESTQPGEIDHGTQVVGIIAGRSPAGAPLGLNPYAKIVTYEVDFSSLNDPAKLASLGSEIDSLSEENVDVANFSFGYMLDPERGANDPVLTGIQSLRNSTLFVMAAGNYGTDRSHICDIRQTCFDMPNVIVVAGLDRSLNSPSLERASTGKLLSDYGSRVHIGAIGANVFSTIAYGRYGTMSGSSFAAPQVAAVASLMMKKYKTLTPQEIKNRLIYCSDYVIELSSTIFGGRLDAACALDGDKASLELVTSPGHAITGYFNAETVLSFKDRESGA